MAELRPVAAQVSLLSSWPFSQSPRGGAREARPMPVRGWGLEASTSSLLVVTIPGGVRNAGCVGVQASSLVGALVDWVLWLLVLCCSIPAGRHSLCKGQEVGLIWCPGGSRDGAGGRQEQQWV